MTSSPQTLDFLLSRRSRPLKTLVPPVPTEAELAPILTAGLRVPDHGKLEPWRLIVLQRPDFIRLADLAGARARELGGDEAMIEKGRGQFERGLLAVAVIASPKPSEKIPPAEQFLSAGALCMNLLSLATAAGWGANWLSGWPSHDALFRARAFGCSEEERVAGLIHIATPGQPFPDRPRPTLAAKVQWGLGDAAKA